ncbi:MAG TPA: carboxymuconolactone decarboxylase family protein, partial [Burkholderiales bacterium]|nr:carboxymuconolactone decarboxylase family protein [Burkholderiales bacterium]
DSNDMTPEAVIARAIARRGEIFDEFRLIATEVPRTYDLISTTAGYMHHYQGAEGARQQLSGAMRELIALCQLAAKGDDRFAANHVRRLYERGVTNKVMFEAAAAIAAIVGWSTIGHVATAILTANDRAYPYGKLPPDGPPKKLTPFPELAIGKGKPIESTDSFLNAPEWRYVAELDAQLARRCARWLGHCLLPETGTEELGPGARAMIALAALCARGEEKAAAHHIRRAYAYGVTRIQVLEAISCVLPMTGAETLRIGVRAMQLADTPPDEQP